MLSPLVITLREGIEAARSIAIISFYLRKTCRDALVPAVWWGLAVSCIASIACTFVLQRIAINSEIFEGVLMLAAAFFVGTMIVWMWRSAKGLKKEIELKIEDIAPAKDS